MKWIRNFSNYEGRVYSAEVDIHTALAIGHYLKRKKYESFRAYQGLLKDIGVIMVNGVMFIVDGRHRARASLDDGRLFIPAKVKVSACQDLEAHLLEIPHNPIRDMPLV